MIPFTAAISIAIFMVAFWALGIARIGEGIISTARDALTAIQDKSLDDNVRETIARKSAVHLMTAFISILVRSLFALLAASAPIWIISWLGWADSRQVVTYLSRWEVVLVCSVAIVSVYILWKRMRLSK